MNRGFIKLYRKIDDWGWYKNANTFRVFLHLLLNANHEERVFEGVTIHRGELASSYESIAKKLGVTPRQVRTAIIHLKMSGEVSTILHRNFQVIILKNYSKYQGESQAPSQPCVNLKSSLSQQTNNYKNYKNYKNNNKRWKNDSVYNPENRTYDLESYEKHSIFNDDS